VFLSILLPIDCKIQLQTTNQPIITETNMKLTNLVQLMALPAVLANFASELVIVALNETELAVVAGKADPSGQMTWMDHEDPGTDQTVRCLGDDKIWTFRGCGQSNRIGYSQVAQFNFTKVTTDPRPFLVNAYSYNDSASKFVSNSSHHMQCQTDIPV
jgi:hypothetical protein